MNDINNCKILGVDPSIRSAGIAAVEMINGSPRIKYADCIKPPEGCLEFYRIVNVVQMIRDNAIRFGAKHVAIEKAAYVQSTKTYQDLCMLQGALVYVLSTEGFEVTLYEPRKVKLEVSGSGSSDKATVADAVYGICGGDGSLSVDETDAVAVALCHIFTKQKASKLPA